MFGFRIFFVATNYKISSLEPLLRISSIVSKVDFDNSCRTVNSTGLATATTVPYLATFAG